MHFLSKNVAFLLFIIYNADINLLFWIVILSIRISTKSLKKYNMETTKTAYGFTASNNLTYNSQVKSVADSEVVFTISNLYGENYIGIYHVPKTSKLNPHKIFKTGDFWEVKISRIIKRERRKSGYSYQENLIEVEPLKLPTDIYIAEHPIGSTVAGKVITETKKGKQLLIALGKNVHCHIKRDHHLSHGAIVSCRLTGYNKKKKTISAELV